jgi:hypothetical protein
VFNVTFLWFWIDRIHEFLKLENEIGSITRQEAVSMVRGFDWYLCRVLIQLLYKSSTGHLCGVCVPSFTSTSCLFLNKPSNCKEQAKFVVLLEFYLYECSLLWLSNFLFLLQIPPLFLDVQPHHYVLDSKIHPNLISYIQSKVCALKLHLNKDCAYWCFCWIQCIHLTIKVWVWDVNSVCSSWFQDLPTVRDDPSRC